MKTILMLLAVMMLPGLVFSQKNFLDQNYIEVTGKAIVKVVPDRIYMRIQLSEKQKNRSEFEAKEKQMLSSLKTNVGIDQGEIVIKDLASNFRGKMIGDDNIVLSKEYLVLVHDGKTANKVISEMQKLEISNIKIDRLDHSKLSDFKKESSVKAITAAKLKAESLTHSIGQSIGRAIYIEEFQFGDPNLNANNLAQQNYAYKEGSSDWFMSDLEFNEISVECTILVRFELK